MLTQQTWKHPDWIYLLQEKIKHIDLTKFPSQITLEYKIITPATNKYYPDWAIRIDVKLGIYDRVNGLRTTLVNPEGIYLYSAKNFEQIVYVEIERLVTHELKECFQIKEWHDNPDKSYTPKYAIPFDPHNYQRPLIKFASYDKVDIYRHYPSWLTATRVRTQRWWKKRITSFRARISTRYNNMLSHLCQMRSVKLIR